MACQTCDHTMQHVGISSMCFTYWCPRCGSLKEKWGLGEDEFAFSQPKLVERVVEFCGTLTEDHEEPFTLRVVG
jgi:hypothetical protein